MKNSASRMDSRANSRRDFLRRSGQSVAAAALAGVIVPRVHAAEAGAIKLALVGCGGRGTGAVVDAFATSGGPIKLVAMADLFEHRLKGSLQNLTRAAQDKVEVTPERSFLGFDGYKKAIDCLSPGDVVILTTSSVFRPLHFEYAVQKGVNVFMEKAKSRKDLRRFPYCRNRRNCDVGFRSTRLGICPQSCRAPCGRTSFGWDIRGLRRRIHGETCGLSAIERSQLFNRNLA